MEPSSRPPETTTHEAEDRHELERHEEFKADLLVFGLALSFVTGSLLCSFVIPGLSHSTQICLWQGAAFVFVATVITMRRHVKKFGCSVPKIQKPETLTGADLC